MQKFTNETEFLWDETEEFVGYTTIDNYICNNEDVEFNSQGIYLQIVKFKNSSSHKVYMSSLEKTGKGSRRDIQRGIVNLRMEGFIIRELIRESGKIKGVSYKIRRSPLKLTEAQKLEIYKESKINKEYIRKIYGKEYAEKLENLSIPCVPTVSTDYPNCAITNCAIANCVTKKENRLKDKISKKENKDDDTQIQAKQKKESSSSKPINQELIEQLKEKWLEVVKKRFILSQANKEKLTDLGEKYGQAAVIEALDNVNNSDYLKEKLTLTHFINHFEKIARGEYDNHAVISNPVEAGAVSNKVLSFNSLGENSREINFEHVGRLENLLNDYKLGLITKEQFENMRDILMQEQAQ